MTAAVILTAMDCSDLRVAAMVLAGPAVGGEVGHRLAETLRRIEAAARHNEGGVHLSVRQPAALDQPGSPYV